jgi:hypothetical protein
MAFTPESANPCRRAQSTATANQSGALSCRLMSWPAFGRTEISRRLLNRGIERLPVP